MALQQTSFILYIWGVSYYNKYVPKRSEVSKQAGVSFIPSLICVVNKNRMSCSAKLTAEDIYLTRVVAFNEFFHLYILVNSYTNTYTPIY